MRIREQNYLGPASQTWRWTDSVSNPNPAWSTASSANRLGEYKLVRDVVTPDFKERRSNGEIIVNPFTALTQSLSTTHNGVILRKQVGSRVYTGDLRGPGWGHDPIVAAEMGNEYKAIVHDPQVQQLTRIVSTEARARIGESGNTFLVSAGEAASTLRYLTNPFATGLKLAHALERRISKLTRAGANSAEVRKRAAELVLEYNYGIRPLVKEVEALVDEFLLKVDKGPRASSQRAFAKDAITSSFQELKSGVVLTNGLKCDFACKYHIRTEVSSGFYYSLSDGGRIDTNRDLGMRLTDIPRAAWAVMPNSFIIDWLANVGSFISAITPLPGLTILASWLTTHSEKNYSCSASNWTLATDSTWYGIGGTGTSTFLEKEIVRATPAPLPSLALKVSTDRNPSLLNAGQAGSLLALWTARHKEVLSLFTNMQRR